MISGYAPCTLSIKRMAPAILFMLLIAILLPALSAHAQENPKYNMGEESEYDMDFDIPEAEKDNPFEFWGQAEFRGISRFLNDSSAQYKQRFYNKDQENPAHELRAQIKPELSWKKNDFGAYFRPRIEAVWSQLSSGQSTSLDEPSELFFKEDKQWAAQVLTEEGFVSWHPSPAFTLEAGKKVMKWGKGYAWNPVSFISRPKDVNDPDRSREGYVLAYADSITSLEGPISTLALTPVVSMVSDNINKGLASGDSIIAGGKLYMLAYDTDIDLLFMTGENYDTRFGIDFATNISENFAIHGESSLRLGYDKKTIDSAGVVTDSSINAWSMLLGARYLTEYDTTFILEYYHNGEGYSPTEMRQYFTLIDDGYDQYVSTGSNELLKKSSGVSSNYNKSSCGQNYIYLRISQKEPFDILYLTPTLTTIANIGDGSFSLKPEISYMASSSLEIKPRMVIPIGPAKSEFGEKLNSVNAELRLTYFF